VSSMTFPTQLSNYLFMRIFRQTDCRHWINMISKKRMKIIRKKE
jgi:hypothetical protein